MRLIFFVVSLLALPAVVNAAEIGVVGLFPGKAVLVVDGKAPKTYSVGATLSEGVKLIAATPSTATIEMGSKRQTIALGEHVSRTAHGSGPASVTLQADGRGHFVVQCQINGGSIRMLVDTGATLIALPASDAMRLGVDYKKGQTGMVNTANGVVPVYRVMLNTVRIGDVELNQVEAFVQESGLTTALLGMSFLNRTEMQRSGEHMILTKRY